MEEVAGFTVFNEISLGIWVAALGVWGSGTQRQNGSVAVLYGAAAP